MISVLKRKEATEEDFFPETNDFLVIFNVENRTSDIKRISEIRENTIYVTGQYAIPVLDCHVANGPEGRIFLFQAPSNIVNETTRLAQLEQSIVLNKITQYKIPTPEPTRTDFMKVFLMFMIFVLVMVLAFK